MYLLGILFLHAATAALPVLPDPPKLPHSVAAAHQDTKVHKHIHNAPTTSAPTKAKKDTEKIKKEMLKTTSMVFPPPPQLPPYDYSVLKKQKADQKQKFNDAPNHQVQKSQKEKEAVILNLEKSVQVEVPPKPATLIDSKTVPQDSEAHTIIQSVTTDSAPVADMNDDQKVKRHKAKIATIVRLPNPELPPFDYSKLRKQNSDQSLKSEFMKQAAEKSKKEKEATILDLEQPVKVKISLIPATWPNFIITPQESDISANILGIATDSTPGDKKDSEEVKYNTAKITTVFKPPSPEPTPFDYFILRKEKSEHNLKSEHSEKQEVMKPKEEKEMVNLDLKKPVKVGKTHPATDSVATDAAVVDKKDNEEAKLTIDKITLDVIPPPPELPLFDSSILQKHKSEQKQKSDHFFKQEVDKSKKDKEVLIINKPVEVKVEEPKLIEKSKLVRKSKPMVESKPVEESKPKEELKKEPVKHSEDIPVIIKWTIPTAPFLSKLVSNNPPLPSLGFNWPSQRPSKSRLPRIIYSKRDLNGIIHTN